MSQTKIFIKLNHENASKYYNDLTISQHEERKDSGVDLYAMENTVIKPFETKATLVDLGVACTSNDQNSGLALYPRSSISKTPLMMANHVGVIDASYRGNVKAAFRNLSNEPYEIQEGQRLVQICLPSLTVPKVEIVEELNETLRGEGCFGSTNNI